MRPEREAALAAAATQDSKGEEVGPLVSSSVRRLMIAAKRVQREAREWSWSEGTKSELFVDEEREDVDQGRRSAESQFLVRLMPNRHFGTSSSFYLDM